MKILLIYPPFASTWGLPLGFGEPLGIAYVAAAIEASGRHQVALLDGVGSRGPVSAFRTGQVNWIGLSHEEVLAEIAKIDFDAIGVSACRTSAVDPGIERLIGRIRATHPGVPIIVGGPDASHLWDHYAQNPDIDYVVIGEGEKTMIDLLDALQRADGVTEVKGIAFRGEDGTVIRAPDQDILDIDTLPWPARHLLPMLTYIRHRPTSDLPSATILTSRACPFSCAFCSTIHIWGRKWRGRAAKDVVDEIEFLHRTYGVTEIRIQDDNFCVNRQRVHDICDLILERQLEIRLHIDPGVMFMLADQEMLSKLHRVGVRHLNMQLESGCQTTQAYINKKIDLSHVRAMVTHAHSLGMTIHTNVILGFPFETKAEMIDSVQTAVEIGFDNIDFNYLDPKGDTRVRRDFIAAGLLCPDDHIELPIATKYCSVEEIREVHDWAIEQFARSKRAGRLGKTFTFSGKAIRQEKGHCFTVTLPGTEHIADRSESPLQSPARIFENERPLGPAHAQHDYIRAVGEGAYSHWGGTLYFSSSDKSDPRTNNKKYRVEC